MSSTNERAAAPSETAAAAGGRETAAVEAPVLRLVDLHRQFGPGCRVCRSGLGRAAALAEDATAASDEPLEKNYCPTCGTVFAVRGVSLELYESEVLGIVGESGSGKSTVLSCLYFDLAPTSGSAFLRAFRGGAEDVFSMTSQTRRLIRNNLLGKVYQNASEGLRMQFSSVANIAEKLIAAGGRNVGQMGERARSLLAHVNIPVFRMSESPERFSGGMQQRVQIAKALSNNPPVLLLDEITTGLDLSVQAKVLDLVKQIQRELRMSMILVSHDLSVVRMLADRTLVMLGGRIVERGLTDQILEDPQHPYTQELVHSML